MFTYWIDRKGGSHYHKEDCPMTNPITIEPRYHYEPITRTKPRKKDIDWGLTRIRDGGKYYVACACLFQKRRTIKSPPKPRPSSLNDIKDAVKKAPPERSMAEALRKKTYHLRSK